MACAYNDLGAVYTELSQTKEAEEIYQNALRVLGDEDLELRSKIKENLGDILELEEKYDEAIALYQDSKANYQDKEDLARINNTIGVAYWNKGDVESAIAYFKESVNEARQAKILCGLEP